MGEPTVRMTDQTLQAAAHCHAPIHPPAPVPTPMPHPALPLKDRTVNGTFATPHDRPIA